VRSDSATSDDHLVLREALGGTHGNYRTRLGVSPTWADQADQVECGTIRQPSPGLVTSHEGHPLRVSTGARRVAVLSSSTWQLDRTLRQGFQTRT
jgi:hypothetical protein